MTKMAFEQISCQGDRFNAWKKTEREKLLKTKTECIEWLERQTNHLLAEPREVEKFKKLVERFNDMRER